MSSSARGFVAALLSLAVVVECTSKRCVSFGSLSMSPTAPPKAYWVHAMWLTSRRFAPASVLIVSLAIAGCAVSHAVEHGFAFDAIWESPEVQVLDFRYGRSSNLATMARPPGNTDPKVPQASSTYGPMPRPDRLIVSWRIRATGQLVEETVDLDRRLPADIKARRVHFVIKGHHLCVYVVSKDLLPKAAPSSPLRLYPRQVVNVVYPDSPANQVCL